MKLLIHKEGVQGLEVDPQTRCAHYHSDLDIIAIKFKCCGEWFPCFECHSEIADHESRVWLANEYAELVILCGACGHKLSITEYVGCNSKCPACKSQFNPGCLKHHYLYFEQNQAGQ
ncbi:MAG: CHY zinc finger protein [Pyrinomonadaceae bacterium]